MLEGVHLSDYADNQQFFGTSGSDSDYTNIFKMSQEMYRELREIKHNADPEESVDRRYVQQLAGKFPNSPAEAPTTYKEPPKGATPIATQRKTIYFEPNSAKMGLDSRAVVDEIGEFMRAYENTVVDIEGNTDSSGSRDLNMGLSKERADTVKNYLVEKFHFPPARMRTMGNGPDRPLADNDTPDGREKNRRTDIKVYPNPAKQ
jgi:outer membrane protein OmpA-like peptidoglycan-associated protein